MSIKDLMTSKPQCASKNTSLQDIAKMMDDCDCGMIPIVEQNGKSNVLGTVTDRDITIRAVSQGKNPLDLNASDVMSGNPICINQDADDNEAEQLMGQHQIRRLIVVDDNNNVVGVLAQADLARNEPQRETGKVVQQISKPSGGQQTRSNR
ncbi:CBS domain-containing protein [Persicimonas caeni]|uniref:CBS domain-containing protein n=1 Tax=Persicimonas caeni TaxID=2292766 RepID=A0A4Y6PWG1_PERCE|nr:CBS domain-containing protein [Persicimonas caeni]QDG52560.1 CBS domain-containing protein [Persicimonas caeni]QED33782.1 CBS domain-containing protein [Persicimonas caeni]